MENRYWLAYYQRLGNTFISYQSLIDFFFSLAQYSYIVAIYKLRSRSIYTSPLQCPNLQDYNRKHINQRTFLSLIRQQLTIDYRSNADYKPLYIKGAREALFKVRLQLYRYTLVAKGIVKPNFSHLQHKQRIYEHVRPI